MRMMEFDKFYEKVVKIFHKIVLRWIGKIRFEGFFFKKKRILNDFWDFLEFFWNDKSNSIYKSI